VSCTAGEKTAGPTPWHLPRFPNNMHTEAGRTWRKLDFELGRHSRVCLLNATGEFLVMLDFHWYACAITWDSALLWREYRADVDAPNDPAHIQFHLLDFARLSPITDLESAVAASDYCGHSGIHYNGDAVAKQTYLAAFPAGVTKISAPDEFRRFGSVLVIADVGSSAGYDAPVHTAILEFDFQDQTVTSYPQDWFNNASLDFGYQWISRVWRDQTGRLCGDGVRIGEFRLDSTGRHMDRSFFGL
jgi:hypothetical protein